MSASFFTGLFCKYFIYSGIYTDFCHEDVRIDIINVNGEAR